MTRYRKAPFLRRNSQVASVTRVATLIAISAALLGTAGGAAYAGGGFDIPTGAAPSPLFGALPFTQKMLPFEEFGVQPLPGAQCPGCAPLPAPANPSFGPWK